MSGNSRTAQPQTHRGRLSDDDAVQFYRILWSLYAYGSRRLKLDAPVTPEDFVGMGPERVRPVRDKVYATPGIIPGFVRDNPFNLNDDDLAIASSWTGAQPDCYVFERCLKAGAIVMCGDIVYQVVGIMERFDEILGAHSPPVYATTTLLPFRDVLTYEGLLVVNHVFVESDLRAVLASQYRMAKAMHAIVRNVETAEDILAASNAVPDATSDEQDTDDENWLPLRDRSQELDEIMSIARTLRRSRDEPDALAHAFTLLRASVELTRVIADPDSEWQQCDAALKKVRRALSAVDRSV